MGSGVLQQCNLAECGDISYVQAENRPSKRWLGGSLDEEAIKGDGEELKSNGKLLTHSSLVM